MSKKKLVVMVDDDEMQLSILGMILRTKGFEVLAYNSPERALHDFETRYFNRPVDLLMTDLDMPVLNGNELCREVKKLDSQVSCLMVTAASKLPQPMYADQWLRKGQFTVARLIDTVKTMTARKRGPKAKVSDAA